MKDLGHGANVEQIANIYNKNPKDIIDFSSNINPKIIKGLETYILEGLQESRSYPDINYTNLRNNISKYIDILAKKFLPYFPDFSCAESKTEMYFCISRKPALFK